MMLINQPIYQSANQPISQLFNQSPTDRPFNQTDSLHLKQNHTHFIYFTSRWSWSTNQSIYQPINQSANHSITNRPTNQSNRQSFDQSIIKYCYVLRTSMPSDNVQYDPVWTTNIPRKRKKIKRNRNNKETHAQKKSNSSVPTSIHQSTNRIN